MECKLLEKQDIELMKYFVDDENTKYDEVILNAFLEEKNAFGYIAKENDVIVGFAFGYVLVNTMLNDNRDLAKGWRATK